MKWTHTQYNIRHCHDYCTYADLPVCTCVCVCVCVFVCVCVCVCVVYCMCVCACMRVCVNFGNCSLLLHVSI